jgi:hypothetical protein
LTGLQSQYNFDFGFDYEKVEIEAAYATIPIDLLFVKKYGRTEGLKERIILGMNLC